MFQDLKIRTRRPRPDTIRKDRNQEIKRREKKNQGKQERERASQPTANSEVEK